MSKRLDERITQLWWEINRLTTDNSKGSEGKARAFVEDLLRMYSDYLKSPSSAKKNALLLKVDEGEAALGMVYLTEKRPE